MAELYFKVKADYEDLIKMQREATRLQEELANCTSKADFSKFTSELSNLQEKMRDLAEHGAKNFAEKFKELNDGSPEFFKDFDNSFAKYSQNVVKNFDHLIMQYSSMLDQLIAKSQELGEAGNAPKMKEQIDSLIDEVRGEVELAKAQKEVWQGNYDEAKIEALQITKEQLVEEEKKLEVLKQQLDARKAIAEQSVPTFGDKVGQFVTGSKTDTHAQDVAAVEQATQAYEVQKNVVSELRGEQELLESQLSKAAQQQLAEAEAVRQESEAREAYVEKLKETSGVASNANVSLDGLIEKGSAADKALAMGEARQGFTDTKERLKELEEELTSVIQQYKDAIKEKNSLEQRMVNGDETVSVGDVEAAKAKVAELKQGVEDTAYAYNSVNASMLEYRQQLDDASGKQLTMRTQMRQAREELARMIEEGKAGTPEFQKAAIEAGKLSRQFKLANASMSYFANPTRHLAALKTGLQGVAGAAGLVNGVIGLFNDKSERMAEIQTKVQSVMAVVVGLETTYNLIKKTSTFMMALEEVKTLAVAAARRVMAIGTTEAAAAQEALNVAMASNPYGAVIAVVAALGAAIYGLVSALGEAESQTNMSKAAAEALDNALANQMRTAAGQITAFMRLKKAYDESGGKADILTKKIINNKEAQDKAGISINNLNKAHRAFSGKNAEHFVKACNARAVALAAEAANAEMLGKTMSELSKVFAKFMRGEEVNFKEVSAIVKDAGVKDVWNLMYESGFDTDNEFLGLPNIVEKEGDKRSTQQKIQDFYKGVTDRYFKDGIGKMFEGISSYSWDVYDTETESIKDIFTPEKNGGSKKSPKRGSTSSRSANNTIDQSQANRDDASFKRQEDLRKQAVEKRKRALQNEIKLETDTQEKRKKQNELAELESKEFFRNMLMQEIAYQKSLYDEKHKDTNNKVSFYKSEEFHKFELEEFDKFNKNIKELNLERFKNEMETAKSIMKVQEALAQREDFQKELKTLDQFFDKRIQIEKKYAEKRSVIEKAQGQGVIDEAGAQELLSKIASEEKAEVTKAKFADYKNNPLFEVAMSDTTMDYTRIKEIRDGMVGMINQAMSEAEPADFKGILDSYVKITDVMIEKNPFEVMKTSATDLKKATDELNKETNKLNKDYKELGMNAAHEETEGGLLWSLRSEKDVAKSNRDNARQGVEDAQNRASKATERANQAQIAYDMESDPTKKAEAQKVLTEALKEQAIAMDSVTEAVNSEKEAEIAYNKAASVYYNTKDKATNQEKKVAKASQKQTAAQNANNKATKASIKLIGDWANALKEAAGQFQSPIANAISGMADLAMTTLNSIQAIKDAGSGAVKGLEKVTQAVNKAVAILAIIQAAWQVINTIMSLFTGKEEERYKQKVDGLKAQISSLDWLFNKLKEDMDKAWGTEALDAYSRALDTLNDKQQASLELIRTQANKHIGHHSLSYYQSQQSGITAKELRDAKEYIKSLGGDVSGDWVTDWLYTLTPEQLRDFMASGIGTTIMGKLGGVAGTGDYSGSDWLADMQAYANTAKDVEDLTLEMAEKLNGISLDGLKDEFKSLVTTFETSLNDMDNSFDAFMREGIYNKMRSGWEDQLSGFYEELEDLNRRFNGGEMSEEEYRRAIQDLRNRYKKAIKDAQDEYQAELTASGVNVKDVEQSATSGGFEAMSEDTATELNGRFAAMQAMETVTAEQMTQMVSLQTNVVNIADEIRTIQVNSYLELQAISENTRKMVEPVLEIQGNVKQIKENTDRL